MKLVIFDLDGTLIDSSEDIARSVNELLELRGRPTLPHDRIRTYVGDGVRKLLERSLPGAAPAEIAEAQDVYLSIYRRRLLDTTQPFPGAADALEELHRRGLVLAVLTNKPLRESRMILDGLELTRYFRAVYGGDSFERRKPDPLGVRRLMEEAEASAAETILVGDSAVDVETARNARIRSCLVSYGQAGFMGARLEADLFVDDLRELAARL